MSFIGLPAVPQSGISSLEFQLFNALRQNIEQLTGQSGNGAYRAIIRGQLTVLPMAALQSSPNISATGRSYTISGVSVAATEDVVALAGDVQRLINDVSRMQSVLNTLILQLKA